MASMVAAYGRRPIAHKVAAFTFSVLLAIAGAAVGTASGAAAAPLKLLVFGDSLGAGYGLSRADGFEAQLAAALKQRGLDVTILDGAVSGDTSAGGRARIDWALADKPDAAFIEIGGNDGLRGLPVTEMQDNLAFILDHLDQARVPTLLSGMFPPPNLGADYTKAFRAVFDTLGKRPGLLYDPFFLQNVALHPELIQGDGIHPNAAGVRIEVARLLPLVEQLLRRVKS